MCGNATFGHLTTLLQLELSVSFRALDEVGHLGGNAILEQLIQKLSLIYKET